LAKIFGDLMMLLEADKRSEEWAIIPTRAPVGEKTKFFIPSNLHIIGTMNTADRSLALVDYALRRRFAFIKLAPRFDAPGFLQHLMALGLSEAFAKEVIGRVRKTNEQIAKDVRLGRGFEIGHSYFCQGIEGVAGDEWVEHVIATELEPLLDEYGLETKHTADLVRLLRGDGA